MDRKTAKLIIAKMTVAANEVAKELGLEANFKSGSFSDTTFSPKFVFSGTDASGRTQAEKEWDLYSESMGLKKEWLGKKYNNKTIIGLDMKKRKYPVLLKSARGTVYKADASMVKMFLS